MRTIPLLLCVAAATVSSRPLRAQFVIQEYGLTDSLLGIDDVELTPDGQYAIARDNTASTSARIYDLATGLELAAVFPTSSGTFSGVAQDAVASSDERAFVIGSRLLVLDLTQIATPLIAEHDIGSEPRDLALTPDGSMLAVRGGRTAAGSPGGLFIFDAASGAQLVHAPGNPDEYQGTGFDVDSVVADDEHAVFTSMTGTTLAPLTRVTIFDLHPTGGGPPAVVFETSAATDQLGAPHDVALFPDGSHAAVRSELDVALYRLDGASSTRVWRERLFGAPGPFGGSALDSIEVSDEHVATISRWSNGGIGAQIDVYDVSGAQRYDRVLGDPHDLAITPDGRHLVVRTSSEVHLYDLHHGGGIHIEPRSSVLFPCSHTSWGAGLDSLAVTDGKVVALARNGGITRVGLWRIEQGELVDPVLHVMPDLPVDLAITPDKTRVVVSGLGWAQVIDLRTGALLLDHNAPGGSTWPWCDGVAVNDERAVAFGYVQGNSAGWLTVIDLFDDPSPYCAAGPNSTGRPSEIFATGSASIAANELELWTSHLPPGQHGLFAYGSGTAMLPFGNGFACLGGNVFHFAPIPGAGEIAHQVVDFDLLTGAGAILPGSTWHFQYLHRDVVGAGYDSSAGLTIDFGP